MKFCLSHVHVSVAVLVAGAPASSSYQPLSQGTTVHRTRAPSSPDDSTRRSAIFTFPMLALMAGVAASPSPSAALDVDSFIAKELDSKKVTAKMSDDEALCKFGSPAKATGEACLRAGLSTKRPTGVDAFGTVDRGDFVKCKPKYVDDPKNQGMLVNVW
eukprot:CAMPEP_0197192800 /NCGR_PEP_ID=MMETSP1423-20130617/25758_1 /TAXON_ID=476441 /ORGANISM="Pseudo-nitzschia heimii, Strain UNC1101" /LENGTH=158 /DNA_ID=CAMNT_0042645771 /DNA_START=77 /DNA_END=550 /DNA_ORIENTATION=-